jgi:hypothetical protein
MARFAKIIETKFRSDQYTSFQMDSPVAFPTERDEILFGIMAHVTPWSDMVNFESHT